MRITLGDIRTKSRVPSRLNLCPQDTRVADFVNLAQQRLLTRGRWWSAYARFNICSVNGCITFPGQIASVERAAVCGIPVPVYDMWWEFLESGFGTEGQNTGCTNCGGGFGCGCSYGAKYRGRFPTFDDITGINKKLRLVCDLESDVDKEVLILGYDYLGNWIRTEQSGVVRDGEIVSLSQSPGTLSTKMFSQVTDIQPPDDLDGQWWLYEYNTDTTDLRMLGQYQYWETRPSYPRYLFGGVRANSSNGDCNKTLIEVIAKLEFIPVVRDTDYLILGNIPAIEEAVEAIKYSEPPCDLVKSEAFLARAIRELDFELDHYLGAGRRIGMNVITQDMGTPVENFI